MESPPWSHSLDDEDDDEDDGESWDDDKVWDEPWMNGPDGAELWGLLDDLEQSMLVEHGPEYMAKLRERTIERKRERKERQTQKQRQATPKSGLTIGLAWDFYCDHHPEFLRPPPIFFLDGKMIPHRCSIRGLWAIIMKHMAGTVATEAVVQDDIRIDITASFRGPPETKPPVPLSNRVASNQRPNLRVKRRAAFQYQACPRRQRPHRRGQ